MSGIWLYLRLAVATAVVLAPGWAIARAIGMRGVSATVAWGFAAILAALVVTFAVSASLTLTLVLLLALLVAALPGATRRIGAPAPPGWLAVGAGGALLGLLLWRVAGSIGGDGLFHLARTQKLLAFDDLSLDAVTEFPDGGLHPGYALPLWHGFLALVAKVSFADPAEVVLHESSVLAPVAALVAYEAGWVLFRRAIPAVVSAAAGIALVAMAPRYGGAYTALGLPATGSRQILVPATLALALLAVHAPTRRTLVSVAAGSLALVVVHPTYAIFLFVPFAGFVAVRWLWQREDLRGGLLAGLALVVPIVAFASWLFPVLGDTASVGPGTLERARGFAQYEGQLNGSPDSFSVVPELFGRTGAVAVAALVLLPLAAFATRWRWAAFVVGGSLTVFALTLVPFLFTALSDVVSLSQSRRLAGFVPLTYAVAGGIEVLAGWLGLVAAPVALGAAILFQLLYPGDFGYTLEDGGPAWATWIAVAGVVVALGAGLTRRVRQARWGTPLASGLAAVMLLLPVYVHGFSNWSASPARPPSPLTPGLVATLQDVVPKKATVYADPESSYRVGAFAPLYVCVNPPAHVADTEENRPYERRREFRRFARTGDLAIPRACGAQWLLIDRARFDLEPELPVAYRDGRYTLYALGSR
jgi:hypothetical protein